MAGTILRLATMWARTTGTLRERRDDSVDPSGALRPNLRTYADGSIAAWVAYGANAQVGARF